MTLTFRLVLGLFACVWTSLTFGWYEESIAREPLVENKKAKQPARKRASTLIEHVTKKPRRGDGTLGTSRYTPSNQEKSYFKKLATEEITTGGLAGNYEILKKHGKYVGWFGIVRTVEEDRKKNRTTLLIEHKYFDGLTDTHIQALSFNGSGDFTTVLTGVGHKIPLLTLIKVYGKVGMAKGASMPTVHAQYVRNWHWGTFTFLFASGKQRGSKKWRKHNKVALNGIYSAYPDDRYYQLRLGKRPSVGQPKQKR